MKTSSKLDDMVFVHVINNARGYRVDKTQIVQMLHELCCRLGISHFEVCARFVGPIAMRKLNKSFRSIDKSTDVLSFHQYQWKKPLKVLSRRSIKERRRVMNPMPLGDIVISLQDAESNARESGHRLDYEVMFLLVHGLLHLVGHDHMDSHEKKIMFAEQRKLVRVLDGDTSNKAAWSGCVRRVHK